MDSTITSADLVELNIEESERIDTREEWMTALADRYLWPRLEFARINLTADDPSNAPAWAQPKVRISVGFPKGGRKAIGQCFSQQCSADGTFEIFVSPELEPFDVCHVLLHELVHSVVGLEAKHKKPFRDLARSVGLAGKMTATIPSESLRAEIDCWLEEMPKFPHAPLRPVSVPKQSTRLIKVECQEEGLDTPGCGYTMRVTAKWLKTGTPSCPNETCLRWHQPMFHEPIPLDDDEAEALEE